MEEHYSDKKKSRLRGKRFQRNRRAASETLWWFMEHPKITRPVGKSPSNSNPGCPKKAGTPTVHEKPIPEGTP